jgi:hypothetical protein
MKNQDKLFDVGDIINNKESRFSVEICRKKEIPILRQQISVVNIVCVSA